MATTPCQATLQSSLRPLLAIRGRALAESSVSSAQGTGQQFTYLVYRPRAETGARPRALRRQGQADHRATATWPGQGARGCPPRSPPALQTALTFNSRPRLLFTDGRGAGAPSEIDALTPRPARGLPVPCNYLTALTEPRNLPETPISSLVSGGRKGNKEAF